MDKEKMLRELLANCTLNALTGIREVFAAAHYDSPSALTSVMTTLARLKLVEVTVLQTAIDALGMKPEDLPALLDDIGKSVLLQMTAAKTITAADAKAMYPGYEMEGALTRAELGSKPYPSHEAAAAELQEALLKIKALREE